MNTSGDAAEQIVRLSLEGMEVALKLTGSTAKNIAAMLYVLMKDKDKNQTKGRARLSSMLKSGKPLTVFTVKNSDLKKFTQEAKQYGVVYCALRSIKANPDGMCDLMVRSEDAPKINRIVERFQLAAVNSVSIQNETTNEKTEKSSDTRAENEKGVQSKEETDKLLDDLFAKPTQKEENTQTNPSVAKTEKSPPSEHSSKSQSKTSKGTSKTEGKAERPSVRAELNEIKEKQRVERVENTPKPQQKTNRETNHQQPKRRKSKRRGKAR